MMICQRLYKTLDLMLKIGCTQRERERGKENTETSIQKFLKNNLNLI